MSRVLTGLAWAAGLALASPAGAQSVNECDWVASAWLLAEPWEENSRTFSNGAVRIALLDAIEPGAAPFHLLVLSPPYDELGARQCRVLSVAPGIGFSGVEFPSLQAWYDPETGLFFSVLVSVYEEDTGDFGDRIFDFTLNQATGAIGVHLGHMGE